MKLLGYIRVSRVNGREGESFISPDQQRAAIEAYATAHGHTVKFLAPDLDESGKSLDRPSMQTALEAVRAGKADGIIAARLDRITRRVGDMDKLLREARGEVDMDAADPPKWNIIACDLGLDLSTRNGRFVAGNLTLMAEWFLDGAREGWAAATSQAAARGIYVGPKPVGYDKDATTKLLSKNADARAVARAFELRANGASWSETARSLMQAGVKTAGGAGEWGINSVRSLVGNRIYKGIIANGHEHFFAEYAVVSAETWEAAQGKARLVDEEPTKAGRRDGGTWAVLGGLVFCDGCGHRMSPSREFRGENGERVYKTYRCQNTPDRCKAKARIDADTLEAYVIETAFEYYRMHGSETRGRDADPEKLAALEHELALAKGRARTTRETYDSTDPEDAAQLERQLAAVEAAKAALAEERGLNAETVSAEQLAAEFEAADTDGKRAIARRIICRIEVSREPKQYPAGTLGAGATEIDRRVVLDYTGAA